jgi:hypothetical protein
MKKISKTDLEQMEKQARTNLVNSLSGIQPANLIGSISLAGISNVAIFNYFYYPQSIIWLVRGNPV